MVHFSTRRAIMMQSSLQIATDYQKLILMSISIQTSKSYFPSTPLFTSPEVSSL